MDNQFNISLPDASFLCLSGNALGKMLFYEQVKDSIDYQKSIIIILPPNLSYISSSFIQGFFEELAENIGIPGIEQQVDIRAEGIPDIKEHILKELQNIM